MLNLEFGPGSYVLLAQTGSAASLIGGQTIHSKLKISVDSQLNSLSQRDLMELQEDLRSSHFVIIDKMSLIGCALLKKIDMRLRQAKGSADVLFGGLFFCFAGRYQTATSDQGPTILRDRLQQFGFR